MKNSPAKVKAGEIEKEKGDDERMAEKYTRKRVFLYVRV